MKNIRTISGFAVMAAIVFGAALLLAGCGGGSGPSNSAPEFTSALQAVAYLSDKDPTTAATPYAIKVTIPSSDLTTLGTGLRSSGAANRYVSIDLSGCSFATLPNAAFNNCDTITHVTLPNVTSIGDRAFNECDNLKSITIPNGVVSIGSRAFYFCMELANITLPNSVTTIGTEAFNGCKFTSITIPVNVTSIGDGAFGNCTRLNSVTFQGVISSSGFANNLTNPNPVFFGDLRAKFYATDATNGTPGTYTTPTTIVNSSSVWTKQ